MKEKRDRPFVSQVLRIECQREGMWHHMMAVYGPPLRSGCFSMLTDMSIQFHESDFGLKRKILYESVQRVERTINSRKEKVRLRP